MTNPERCPKCGAGAKKDHGKYGASYECGRYMYGDRLGEVDHITANDCRQRQLDQQAEQLQSLAERVKVLENHFPDAGKKEGGDE